MHCNSSESRHFDIAEKLLKHFATILQYRDLRGVTFLQHYCNLSMPRGIPISITIYSYCRMFSSAGVVALNGLLYVVGGDDGTSNLASVEVYAPRTDTWVTLPACMGIGRSYAGVAIIDKPLTGMLTMWGMPAAGQPADVDIDGEPTDHLREAGPSGASALHPDQQNGPLLYQQLNHDCEGARCLCQRYENGELAAAVLNLHGRNDAEGYQNLPARGGHRPRANQPIQNHPNLNPNYQNPLDFIQPNENYPPGRRLERRHQEPEENIYERLDEVQGRSNEPDHTYERIDDHRAWYRRARYRGSQNDSQAREAYVESRRLTGPSCLSRLGRNCFSTENIASAVTSNRRYVYQFGNGCSCQFCRHLDARSGVCQYCHNFHDRLRYQDPGSSSGLGNSRHYIYQLSRSCRCPLCRDDSLYARFPVNSRLSDSFRRECHCRNPGSCSCRSRYLSYSNPAIYIGRISQAVHNPLYANSGGAVETNQGPEAPNNSRASSSAGVAVCTGNPSTDRQHVCDDSCIRNQNVNGVYQFLGRCERAECHHGRISIHWVFVNKWLPSWRAQDSVPEADADQEPSPDQEEPREQPENEAEES